MHPRARRAVSVLLSIAVHALVLLEVYSWSVMQPGFPDEAPLPVRIIDEPRPRPQTAAKPPVQPPPQVAAKPPEAAKPIEEPPPQPPAPEPPERKIPLPEQQIVSPSEAGKSEAPPDTRLLSDRDNRVDQQTVKRGNPKLDPRPPGDLIENLRAQGIEYVAIMRHKKRSWPSPYELLRTAPNVTTLLDEEAQALFRLAPASAARRN